MSIQSSVNAILGTAAGVALAGEKMAVDKQDMIKEATVNLPKVNQELASTSEQLEANQVELDKAKSGRNAKGQFRTKASVNKDVEKITLARETLLGQMKALQMSKEGYMKVLGGKK